MSTLKTHLRTNEAVHVITDVKCDGTWISLTCEKGCAVGYSFCTILARFIDGVTIF